MTRQVDIILDMMIRVLALHNGEVIKSLFDECSTFKCLHKFKSIFRDSNYCLVLLLLPGL